MWRCIASLIVLALPASAAAESGRFEGNLVLLPTGCERTAARTCRLGEPLRYTSPGGGLVWQADAWTDGNGESGTTDGASIPAWAQPIIGAPYDPAYIKAAVIHDHYCYEENRVRSWRQTHRMFYDALNDLGISPVKAKIMYYAVYLGGPKWVKLVPGENCGQNCIKSLTNDGIRWEGDQFGSRDFQTELKAVRQLVETSPGVTLEELEARAEARKPGDFFYRHGDRYTPTGPDDPNALPRQ